MDKRLVWHLARISPDCYVILTEGEASTIRTRAIELLSTGVLQSQFSIENLESDEARSMLAAQQRGDLELFVIWPADVLGLKMYYADFVRHYDDLWRTSSDDIWVITSDFKWLLELDHEEVVAILGVRSSR